MNVNKTMQSTVTGYQKSKSHISAGRPNRYKILHKIVRDICVQAKGETVVRKLISERVQLCIKIGEI